LSVVCADKEECGRVLSQLKIVIRTNYSNPPIHGGAVVAAVLANPEWRATWAKELGEKDAAAFFAKFSKLSKEEQAQLIKLMKKDKHLISLSKGVTWRIIGTLDTMMLSYLFTGSIGSALKIGSTEVFTKIILFYLHERGWFKIKWGLVRKSSGTEANSSALEDFKQKDKLWQDSHTRSLIKGISWRLVGTMDTIIIALFWTGDYSKAFKIGLTEVVTKVFLYYLHERIWLRYSQEKAIKS
jgi:uncharacterized membrane protein